MLSFLFTEPMPPIDLPSTSRQQENVLVPSAVTTKASTSQLPDDINQIRKRKLQDDLGKLYFTFFAFEQGSV